MPRICRKVLNHELIKKSRMKYSEILQKSDTELKKDLANLSEKRENLRMKIKLGQVKNVKEYSQIRKDIARILTRLANQ